MTVRNVTITKVLGFPLFIAWSLLQIILVLLCPWPKFFNFIEVAAENAGCLCAIPLFTPVLILGVILTNIHSSLLAQVVVFWYFGASPVLLVLGFWLAYLWHSWSKYHDELAMQNNEA